MRRPTNVLLCKFSVFCATQPFNCKKSTRAISCHCGLTPILKNLLKNAEKCIHASITMKALRSHALFIFSGPFAYEFLHKNLQQALPSARSILRAIHSQYITLDEGAFRLNDLVTHLKNHKTPNIVSVPEDATRIIGRVDYDTETDRRVGFVLPIGQHGLPQVDSFVATLFSAIESMFHKNAIFKYAVVYMVQPLHCNAPPFVLACLGTDNKFTVKHVLHIYTMSAPREALWF